MTDIERAEAFAAVPGAAGDLARAYLKAHTALVEILKYNRIGNDEDAYLYEIAHWGMGNCTPRPDPSEFGL